MNWKLISVAVTLVVGVWKQQGAWAEQCGAQAGGALCPDGQCCSMWGWCGDDVPHCADGCQSQCHLSFVNNNNPNPIIIRKPTTPHPVSPNEGSISDIITLSDFETVLMHRNESIRFRKGFYYSYHAFLTAADSFPDFGTTGDADSRKREIAAFFAQTTGPVTTDPITSFNSALRFWMIPQPPKPSPHDVMTGAWTPSPRDIAAGRVPGYGLVTNIINGAKECGQGPNNNPNVANRVGLYRGFCHVLGVDTGDNLDCYNMRPFVNNRLLLNAKY